MYSMNFLKKHITKADRAALLNDSVDAAVPFLFSENSMFFVCKG